MNLGPVENAVNFNNHTILSRDCQSSIIPGRWSSGVARPIAKSRPGWSAFANTGGHVVGVADEPHHPARSNRAALRHARGLSRYRVVLSLLQSVFCGEYTRPFFPPWRLTLPVLHRRVWYLFRNEQPTAVACWQYTINRRDRRCYSARSPSRLTIRHERTRLLEDTYVTHGELRIFKGKKKKTRVSRVFSPVHGGDGIPRSTAIFRG